MVQTTAIKARLHKAPKPDLKRQELPSAKPQEPANPLDIGDLIHGETYNRFCNWTNKNLLPLAKAGWSLYLPLQVVGLINDKVERLARAWYGVFWSVVYSCYRPWATNRRTLEGPKASLGVKKLYNANEYFRAIMGNVVTAIYGGGALGMLWGWLKGDDDFYDRAAEFYKTGMLNQNQIFGSMNSTIVMRRKYNPDQLNPIDRVNNDYKAKIELVDSILFIPNIITRALDTFKLFGMELSEGVQRIVNGLGYFCYGTWATRYGLYKSSEGEGSDLEKVKDKKFKADQILHNTQKYSGRLFYSVLPGISWIAAVSELCGYREFAQLAFKWEGKIERLLPTIAAWSIRNTWLNWFSNSKETKQIIEATTSKKAKKAA